MASLTPTRLTHGPLRWEQPTTKAGRDLLDRLEARCAALGGCDLKGADHADTEMFLPRVEAEAVAAERARIVAAVKAMDVEGRGMDWSNPDNWLVRHRAVLAIIELQRLAVAAPSEDDSSVIDQATDTRENQ